MPSIGRTLKKLRAAAGIRQGEFASRVGITQSYLSAVEADKKTPSQELVEKMARELGLPSAGLFSLTASADEVKPEYREILGKLLEMQSLLMEQIVAGSADSSPQSAGS